MNIRKNFVTSWGWDDAALEDFMENLPLEVFKAELIKAAAGVIQH